MLHFLMKTKNRIKTETNRKDISQITLPGVLIYLRIIVYYKPVYRKRIKYLIRTKF
jgi:hypothetical protein